MFLTAKAQESDKLLGLMAGGDDYLPKPFSYAELLGRVKAQVRRYTVYSNSPDEPQGQERTEYIESGGIRIHTVFNEVTVGGMPVELTDIEYHILLLMMQNKGKIFSAQNLYESIWNEPYFYNCNGTVMVHGEYLTRILDNISSNILKYADVQALVLVWDEYYTDEMCITFENACGQKNSGMDSYSIGIRNVKTMMEEMGGNCEVVQDREQFRICLRFRYKKTSSKIENFF